MTTIVLFQCYSAFSTDCKTLTFDQEYEYSDLVFLGRVVESNDSTYRIKVIESYKMEVSDTLVGKLIDGEAVPRKGSYWLIYAYGDRATFSITECSGSKSLDRPFGFHDFAFPAPPPKSLENNRPLQDIYRDIQESRSLNEFFFEISSLRELSRKKEVQQLSKEITKLINQNASLTKSLDNLQLWIIGLATFCVILIGLQFRKRPSN